METPDPKRQKVAYTFDKSRIVRQEPMSVEQALQAAAAEGLELVRAAEGKGKGKGAGSVTGFRGVVRMNQAGHRLPYRAQVWVPNGGGGVFLGSYSTPEEAALCVARNKHLVLVENLLHSPWPAAPPEDEEKAVESRSAGAAAPEDQVACVSFGRVDGATSAPPSSPLLAGRIFPSWPPQYVGERERTITKMPTAAPAAGGSHSLVLAPGARVEVKMRESALRGSLFPATVLRLSPQRLPSATELGLANSAVAGSIGGGEAHVLVEYDTLDDDEGEMLVDMVAPSELLPRQPPPPASPCWLEGLAPGGSLEMLCEGGWWHVRLRSCRWRSADMQACDEEKQVEVDVEVVGKGVEKTTDHTQLRPRSIR